MVIAYIALGSNLGDRSLYIERALAAMRADPRIRVRQVSPIVETKALGPVQPDYLNGVAAIETDYAPLELLDRLLAIERALGRERRVRWGPRTIDLDILMYNDQTFNHPRLTIPHPELPHRPFLLEALKELHAPV